MKQLVAVGVGLFALALEAHPASAADMPVKASPHAVISPLHTWTGWYVGAHAGYGWADASGPYDNNGGPGGPYNLNDLDSRGVIGGGHLGYNHQWGQFVGGFEVDISASGIKGEIISADPGYELEHKVGFLASARLRAGIAFDRTLVYGTVGLGYANQKFGDESPNDGYTSVRWRDWGAVYGGGIEFASHNSWLVRLEVLHYDIDPNYAFSDEELADSDAGDVFRSRGVTVGRLGISYKF